MPDPDLAVSPLPARAARRLLARYRGSGADLPWGDPLRAHGVAMEGYFWRFTDPRTGRVLIALNGVNRAADGHWATLGLAAHPGGFLRTRVHPDAAAQPDGLGARAGEAFHGTVDALQVDLGPDARVDARLVDAVSWPRRSFGGSSVFQAVPALNQYWHPWLLGGRVHGTAVLGEQTWDLDGWTAYGEKNWGRGGFPDSWWWGQAQGFAEDGVCVAFAGGEVSAGPLRTTVTAVVVRLPDGRVLRLGDPVVSPVRAAVSDEHWSLRGRSARWSVDIDGRGDLGRAYVLPVPLPAERRNVPGAIEHLAGRMRVVVRHRGRTVWAGESLLAALEHGGIARARAEVLRRGGSPGDTDAAPEVRD
ncbi:tocopherol cyclase family protein [Nocardioides ochotonae]|uniref:tocopherol cyclase family protein n=1 Tax=Nocardioides ochotonae TaxID=2685869 RepID=UPI00140A5AA8|nr:tocopherol cyclase family protein [Nocardioides ochotonae]